MAIDEHRPLDSLLPDLQRSQPIDGMSQGPEVHAQVFEVQLEDGHEWLYSVWREPESLDEFDHQLRRLLEVTQLLYLSSNANDETPSDFRGIRLLVFDQLSEGAVRVLEGVGLSRGLYDAEEYRGRMLSIENQAMQAGWSIPAKPASVWHAAIRPPDPALLGPLMAIETRLRETLRQNRWGEIPGESSKVLADQLKMHFGVEITPDQAGLNQIDVLLLDHTARRFRWMLPGIFRAICDFIGVYLQANHQMRVGWAVGKPDADFPAPPIFRINRKASTVMYPVGMHLIRWTVLPTPSIDAQRMLADHVEDSIARL